MTRHVRRQAGSIDGGVGTDTVVAYQFSSQGIFSTGDLSTLTFTNVERLISGPAITYSLLSQLNSFQTITGGDSTGWIKFDLSGGPGGSIDFSTKLKQADEHIFFRAYKATSAVQVTGTAGDDLIGGSDFADTLLGGDGNDTLHGDDGADTLIGGAGNDIYQTDGSDTLIETLTGAAGGIDMVGSSVSYDLRRSALLQGEFENLTLNGFGASDGFGNDLDNVLIGSGYDNLLNGRAGADTMRGGTGNDIFVVDNIGDVVQEIDWRNDGIETVRSSISFDLSDTTKVIGYIEHVILRGADNLDAAGNALDNSLRGNGGNNVLSGNGGKDKLVGLDGDDTLIGGDSIDALRGGDGNDRITGGAGRDVMTGGADNDIFVFHAVLDSVVGGQRDRIVDFEHGADLMDLSAIDAMSGGTDNAFTFIAGTAFSGTAGELRFFQLASSGQTIVEGDVDGNGAADFQIAMLGLHTVNSGDFIL